MQHSMRQPFPYTHPNNIEHQAGQAAIVIFQVYGMTRPGIEPQLPAFWYQPTVSRTL